ncbi:MAG: DUF2268 domain-containing putative Zn-dependent protease [Bacteroidota bacterium]
MIETSDIGRFWEAYDSLDQATSRADSIAIMQEVYIDQASAGFREFLNIRAFTAEEYIQKIAAYPGFWSSVRPLTEVVISRMDEVEAVFARYRTALPNFKQPNICFAIGGIRTGGTISGGYILIGTEIAAADSSVQKGELFEWMQSVVGQTGDITAMIAHESIHTQQRGSTGDGLIKKTINEGVADFLSEQITGMNINYRIYDYAYAHECEIWQDWQRDLVKNPTGFRNWMYQGNNVEGRPADLGYFIGYRIAQSYYDHQENKRQAIRDLLNRRKYEQIYEESGYAPCE